MRGLLADHDASRVRVAGRQRRHDRCVGHPQTLDPVNPELVVDHRPRIIGRAHPASSHVVVDGVAEVTDDALPVLVGVEDSAGAGRVRLGVEFPAESFKLRRRTDLEPDPDPGDQGLDVVRVVEEVSEDARLVERVGRPQQDPAPAPRVVQQRIDGVAFLELERLEVLEVGVLQVEAVLVERSSVRGHRQGHQVQLHVGPRR